MPDWILWLAEACAPGIIVGIVLAIMNTRKAAKAKKEAEKEDAARQKNELELDLVVATAEMAYALVMAAKRGSPNGEVEDALKRYLPAIAAFRSFERKQLGRID